MRGPVGSLETPADPAADKRLDAEDVAIHVHRDVRTVLQSLERLSFAFGSFGRCLLLLEAAP